MDDSIAIPEEPTLALPPAPRTVVRAQNAGVWAPRLISLPHVVVGIGLVVHLVVLMLWALFGVEVSGEVSAKSTSRSKGRTYYHVTYVFSAGGQSHEGNEQISAAQYRKLERGDDLAVRYFELGPLNHSGLSGESLIATVLPIALFGLIWNVIVAVVIYQLWFLPELELWLCRKGAVTAGVVVAKSETRGRRGAVTRRVRYAYRDSQGTRREGQVIVRAAALWQEASVERPLTVLVAPGRPQWSIAYDFSVNRIEGVG
jgi:hypothetical protein